MCTHLMIPIALDDKRVGDFLRYLAGLPGRGFKTENPACHPHMAHALNYVESTEERLANVYESFYGCKWLGLVTCLLIVINTRNF